MAQNINQRYGRYRQMMLKVSSMYKSRQDIKMYLELLLSLTVISLFAIFAVKPTVLTIIELQQEIEQKRTLVETLDRKIGNLQRAEQLLQQRDQQLALLDQALPVSPSADLYIRQIEGMAAQNSIELSEVESGEVIIKGGDREDLSKEAFTFKVSVASEDYANLDNFLTSLGNARRPLVVKSMQTVASNNEEGVTTIRITLEGDLTYLSLNEEN